MESLKDVQGVNYVFSSTSGEVTGGTVSFKRKKKKGLCALGITVDLCT